MKILHTIFTLCIVSFLVNHSEASTQSEDGGTIKNEIFELSIRNGILVGSSDVIRVTQGTKLTLVLESDEILSLHLHGYDITAKVPQSGKALMKLNTFATGRFPIKIHPAAQEHQGNAHHERTLLYLEVHPR